MPPKTELAARAQSAKPATAPKVASHAPTIGLALGGGGARGLAHILMLEAFDEMGIRPKMIAGTSIGAIYGAAYASGIPARVLRAHTIDVLSQRFALMRDLFSARAQPMQRLLNLFSAPTAMLNADALLELVMPPGTKTVFADLEIPLKIVASDFYNQDSTVFVEGPLLSAVAASMALPAVFEPVIINGRAMIDGGCTNPLPFDLLAQDCDIVVAIDVSGTTMPNPKRDHPNALEALFASAFLFERSIVREKLKSSKPDILINAGTGQFQALEFLKFTDILAAAEPAKARLKAQLARVLSVETLAEIEHDTHSAVAATVETRRPKASRRGLLKRRRKGEGAE